jgi:hypothetical protein
MQNRTIQEFVEDMVSNGKSLKQILIVAAQTRWVNSFNLWRKSKEEIEKEYRRLKS